ncbi:class II aldolase/adducin family protein [Actibacterium sp. MT2.3-13A]|uniref:class II aldolase/adducin family protein n=1 Tax=Actibacterium sp. MT2.3-13A TaxID=2828332 RepID=UPI001BADC489|nr:class II aldolase/adducin family protein [Actibacterium sp. MT2.3-13A]
MDDPQVAQICDAVTILVEAGVLDYNGHVSCRVAGGGYLINSGPSNRRAMTPRQVTHVGAGGEVLEGDRPPNEAPLHTAIYRARPDVVAVVHGHPRWSTLFTATETPLPVVMPQGSLVPDLPVYPSSHSISAPDRGAAVAGLLGRAPGILLRAHGSVLVGSGLPEAVCRAIYLEQNAERAYRGAMLGAIRPIPEGEVEEYRKTLASATLYEKCWNFHSPGGGRDVR